MPHSALLGTFLHRLPSLSEPQPPPLAPTPHQLLYMLKSLLFKKKRLFFLEARLSPALLPPKAKLFSKSQVSEIYFKLLQKKCSLVITNL